MSTASGQKWWDEFPPEVRDTFTSSQKQLILNATDADYRERKGAVPWQCWDIPGFKACHTEAGHRTHRALSEAGLNPSEYVYENPSHPDAVAHQKRLKDGWAQHYKSLFNFEKHQCMLKFGCTSSQMNIVSTPESEGEQDARVNRGRTLGRIAVGVGLFSIAGYLLYRKFGAT